MPEPDGVSSSAKAKAPRSGALGRLFPHHKFYIAHININRTFLPLPPPPPPTKASWNCSFCSEKLFNEQSSPGWAEPRAPLACVCAQNNYVSPSASRTQIDKNLLSTSSVSCRLTDECLFTRTMWCSVRAGPEFRQIRKQNFILGFPLRLGAFVSSFLSLNSIGTLFSSPYPNGEIMRHRIPLEARDPSPKEKYSFREELRIESRMKRHKFGLDALRLEWNFGTGLNKEKVEALVDGICGYCQRLFESKLLLEVHFVL